MTYLASNHGKPLLTRSSRFYRRIQRQDIRLKSDIVN